MDLGELVLAAGAVGTAAMGVTEGFKSIRFKPLGYHCIESELAWAQAALKNAYGDNYHSFMTSLYRDGRRKDELKEIICTGMRIGLDKENAPIMASIVGRNMEALLTSAAQKTAVGEELEPNEKNVLDHFVLVANARVDAAMVLADKAYGNAIRFRAFFVALGISVIATLAYINIGKASYNDLIMAILVGITAVPLAPIAKDVANAFQSAAKAIAAKK